MLVRAVVVMVGLPEIGQDMIAEEDARFREVLEGNGYDTGQLGMRKGEVQDKPGSV